MFPLIWGEVGLALRDRNSYSASGSNFTVPIESGSSPYAKYGGIGIFKQEFRLLGGARGGSAGHDHVWGLGALPWPEPAGGGLLSHRLLPHPEAAVPGDRRLQPHPRLLPTWPARASGNSFIVCVCVSDGYLGSPSSPPVSLMQGISERDI